MRNALTRLLPEWPRVPPRLWLTAGFGALAAANLVLLAEIWPNTPSAGPVLLLATLGAVLAGCCQLVVVLQAWSTGYDGPGWARLLLRMAVVPAMAGCVIIGILGFVSALVLITEMLDVGLANVRV
ncbi:hypothetical protein BEN47_13855 [Hymenobacter lapidarius]|uniref:MotA/TolQ/ExbB proton channel domain-containing protein n=1 Tax=Hymenobacter lapidarius TaxID=1908237 RepID=A0A1G1T503_9BACT|nr:hypothetical protein [Hymenobacter lapidarius]OGX85933.1 hypothetical protein BEN47_13855 [Hymenobacter lapidarius]